MFDMSGGKKGERENVIEISLVAIPRGFGLNTEIVQQPSNNKYLCLGTSTRGSFKTYV